MAENVYVIDTNIVSSLLYEQHQRLLTRIRNNQTDLLILCEPVIYEIERGLYHKQATSQLNRFRNEIFPMFTQTPIQLADWRLASLLWASVRRNGKQLSDIDLLVAAVALRLNAMVVTDAGDFAYVPIVPTENWL